MIRMTETPTEIELSVQTSSEPEPERGPELQPLSHLPPNTQNLHQAQQQSQLQLSVLPQQQLPESNSEHQDQSQFSEEAKPVWTHHRKQLCRFVGICLCAVIVGLVYFTHQNLQSRSGGNKEAHTVTPCLSPACQWASAHLSMSMDPFTRPCDYFLFSCGSDWGRGRQRGQGIPGHPQNQRGQSDRRKDRRLREEKIKDRKTALLQHLREILESSGGPAGSAVQKAKGFYHSCLDIRSIEEAREEPFLTLIQNLGGWAVSGQWNQSDFNSTLGLLMRDYATFPFFNLYVGKDPKEIGHGTNRRYIQIDQPDLLIPIEWNSKIEKSQVKTETLRPFLASCQRYLDLLGAPLSSNIIHVGMFISLSSELAVAAAPLHYRLSKGQLYQRMTIKELRNQAPLIDWLGCLQAAFHPLSLSEDDHVLLHNLPYIIQMSRTVGKWLNRHELSARGPLHTYMIFNLLHTLMPALDSRFSETVRNLSVALGNNEGVVPRWKSCVMETERGFDSVLTHLLSERTARTEAEEIIQNIFSSFKSKLQEQKWTDKKSFKFVMKKVEAIIPKLWTKEEMNAVALDLLFSKVTISRHNFFSNYVQLLSLWQKRQSKHLSEQAAVDDILSVTPFLLGNELIFPLGMFVPPLFHPTYPRAMNYGVVGFLIAKDILHLLLPDIHTQSKTVHAVGECVWAHYLTVTEKAGRGGAFSLSAAQQQEVWVQYSALQIALQAYHRSLKNHPSDTSLSGLSNTHLFLTSFSQVNCDSDPYREFMPLEPSFLITAICAKPNLCPTNLQCTSNTQQHLLNPC
ncbi:kell blood group glycoprotein isoform X2 [Sphaeramia orbicularis]|uniref:Kell blood group glycoprotein-like n=1 Tax=Sphaeramia orbicularis TaxID=375764 RepID=A0A673AG84_9TELE|nr:kell blood group glycoprotein-like isoform X2 [Sphaeramia orbicularis]